MKKGRDGGKERKAKGMEKVDVKEYVISSQSSFRGHSKKLYKKRLKKDVKKYSFNDGAIDTWNPLPEILCQKYLWF